MGVMEIKKHEPNGDWKISDVFYNNDGAIRYCRCKTCRTYHSETFYNHTAEDQQLILDGKMHIVVEEG